MSYLLNEYLIFVWKIEFATRGYLIGLLNYLSATFVFGYYVDTLLLNSFKFFEK